jgi:hypothetical protein
LKGEASKYMATEFRIEVFEDDPCSSAVFEHD